MKTEIFKFIYFTVFLFCPFCPLFVNGQQYSCVKGFNKFFINETAEEYQVYCVSSVDVAGSRSKNIGDRQLRMDAIDLIGAYVLYGSSDVSSVLGPDAFQIYVEGLGLHYNAVLEGIRQEDAVYGGMQCRRYSCAKEAYNITSATYNTNLDVPSLLTAHYLKDRSELSANLLYRYKDFSSEQYRVMERDFLLGRAQIPSGIRQLQSVTDRFEQSVFAVDGGSLIDACKNASSQKPATSPYVHYYYEELISSSSLTDKAGYYRRWRMTLNEDGCVYESILKFCADECAMRVPKENDAVFTNVLEAFPGAISPFGIRQPIDAGVYDKAVQAYSDSDFEKSASLLVESVDSEGISPKTLNLLGASYRYLGKCDKAMSYLLLCFKLAPQTDYLAGNIYLCLKRLGFPRINEAAEFLKIYATDNWSKTELSK